MHRFFDNFSTRRAFALELRNTLDLYFLKSFKLATEASNFHFLIENILDKSGALPLEFLKYALSPNFETVFIHVRQNFYYKTFAKRLRAVAHHPPQGPHLIPPGNYLC